MPQRDNRFLGLHTTIRRSTIYMGGSLVIVALGAWELWRGSASVGLAFVLIGAAFFALGWRMRSDETSVARGERKE
ncbi:MAG TPA: hypothetical protein VNL72_04630 [Gammaproteobacteria bacterium]|nr:hypothetical protein [Gammaproteobacteria bacterium]